MQMYTYIYIIICIYIYIRMYVRGVEGPHSPKKMLQLCIPLGKSTKVLGNIKIPPPLNPIFNWEDQQRY